MLRFSSIVLFVLFVFVSCSNGEEKTQKPADLLDKNKMAAILTDITLMEAAGNVQATQNPTANLDEKLKFNIYKQHMINRTQYEASLKYYSSNPTEFKEIYEIVLQNLNKKKGS